MRSALERRQEILEALKKETRLVEYYHDSPEKPLYNWYPVDTEAFKRVLDDKVAESGCELLLHLITGHGIRDRLLHL